MEDHKKGDIADAEYSVLVDKFFWKSNNVEVHDSISESPRLVDGEVKMTTSYVDKDIDCS